MQASNTTGAPAPLSVESKRMIEAFTALSGISVLSCIVVLSTFAALARHPSLLTLRNSLNYLWIMALVSCAGLDASLMAEGIGTLQGWHTTATCTAFVTLVSLFATLLSCFLFFYYLHIFLVRRYDEPRAAHAIKFYLAVASCVGIIVVVFCVVEIGREFSENRRTSSGCKLMDDAVGLQVAQIVPLAFDLFLVIMGFVSAFSLLCSPAKIYSDTGRRCVWIHAVFMTILFATKLTLVVIPAIEPEGTTFQDATTAVRVLMGGCITFANLLGIIMSAMFVYSECLWFAVRQIIAIRCEAGTADDEAAPLVNSHQPSSQAVSPRESNLSPGGPQAGNRACHAKRSSLEMLERYMQGFTLSYTVRISGDFVDGQLPPSSVRESTDENGP